MLVSLFLLGSGLGPVFLCPRDVQVGAAGGQTPQRGAAFLSRLNRLTGQKRSGLDFQSFSICPVSLTLSTEHSSLASSYSPPPPCLVPPENEGQRENVSISTEPPIPRPCSAWASDTVSCKPVPTSAQRQRLASVGIFPVPTVPRMAMSLLTRSRSTFLSVGQPTHWSQSSKLSRQSNEGQADSRVTYLPPAPAPPWSGIGQSEEAEFSKDCIIPNLRGGGACSCGSEGLYSRSEGEMTLWDGKATQVPKPQSSSGLISGLMQEGQPLAGGNILVQKALGSIRKQAKQARRSNKQLPSRASAPTSKFLPCLSSCPDLL